MCYRPLQAPTCSFSSFLSSLVITVFFSLFFLIFFPSLLFLFSSFSPLSSLSFFFFSPSSSPPPLPPSLLPHPLISITASNRASPPEYVARQFDSVVCLNVLEHIEDDLGALREMRRVIRPGGYLALLVPAHQVLYGKFDEAVGHFRRYSKDPLLKLLKQADFEVTSIKFFNITAVIPWLVNGRIFKRDYLPEDQTRLVNRLVPVLKLERLIGPPCGLSLIALAKKTERSES